MKQQKSTLIIAVFAIIKFLIPFIFINAAFELHRDEYLYLADADHLAWGYIEMPPMLALLGAISKLFDSSLYAVYFWGSLFGVLKIILIGKIVLELKGNVYDVFIACLAFLCSGYLRMNILFQPNFLDGFFWTWAVYLIIKLINTNNKKFFYYLGICFGLGMLAKYTMAFFVLAFLISVMFTSKRKWLVNKNFYFAMLIGLLIFSPNLYWQYDHHFPVMHHMQLLRNQQLQYTSRVEFLINQILMFLSSFFIWILALWFVFAKKEGRKYISIGIIYFVVIGLLLWFKGKPYYAASIYPSLLAIGSVYIEKIIQSYKIKIVHWAIPVFILLITVVVFPIAVPFLSPQQLDKFYQSVHAEKMGVLNWEEKKNNPLPQDFADMLGWKEMAEKTAKVYHELPDSIKQKTMVYGDNYGDAAALAFYRKQYGLPEIYSDDASFAFWLPQKFDATYFLFAAWHMPEANDSFFYHFAKTEIKDSVTQKYAREYGAKIVLYSFPDSTAKAIAERNIRELRVKYNLH